MLTASLVSSRSLSQQPAYSLPCMQLPLLRWGGWESHRSFCWSQSCVPAASSALSSPCRKPGGQLSPDLFCARRQRHCQAPSASEGMGSPSVPGSERLQASPADRGWRAGPATCTPVLRRGPMPLLGPTSPPSPRGQPPDTTVASAEAPLATKLELNPSHAWKTRHRTPRNDLSDS